MENGFWGNCVKFKHCTHFKLTTYVNKTNSLPENESPNV